VGANNQNHQLHSSFHNANGNGNLNGNGAGQHHHGQGFGGNSNYAHHSSGGNWHNHPSRNVSVFLGIGSPFGAYWGYPGYGSWPFYYSRYWSPWYRTGYYGYGGLGYSSFGYGGLGLGYGYGGGYPAFGYQSVCNYNNAYYLPAANATVVDPNAALQLPAVQPNDPNNNLAADKKDPSELGQDFATQGEQEFRAGKYEAAVRSWRHSLVDEPGNGGVMLLMAQALFATGQYDEAAGAVQLGMQMLPVEKWGVVVEHYKELYAKIGDYTSQLRALEKSRNEHPDDPALRFLLGYHYGFLGYPKDGLKQLDKCRELAPKDELALKLQERIQDILNPKPPMPKPAPAASTPADKPEAATPPATPETKTP
jgi:hypothetical protein